VHHETNSLQSKNSGTHPARAIMDIQITSFARPVTTSIQNRLMRRTYTEHLEFIAEWGSETEHGKEHSCIATRCIEELLHHICMMDMIQNV
jgi:hypothetical protein